MAESVSVDFSLRMRRSLTSFGIVLLWSSSERLTISGGPGVRKGDLSFASLGIGIAADVFSLAIEVDVVDGSSEGAGTVTVVLMVVMLVVVVDAHMSSPDVVDAGQGSVAVTVAS